MSEPKWIAEALKLLGTAEIDGGANNPVIMQLYKDCGHKEIAYETTAWCAAMVGIATGRIEPHGAQLSEVRDQVRQA
jgi:hypothetical protein